MQELIGFEATGCRWKMEQCISLRLVTAFWDVGSRMIHAFWDVDLSLIDARMDASGSFDQDAAANIRKTIRASILN